MSSKTPAPETSASPSSFLPGRPEHWKQRRGVWQSSEAGVLRGVPVFSSATKQLPADLPCDRDSSATRVDGIGKVDENAEPMTLQVLWGRHCPGPCGLGHVLAWAHTRRRVAAGWAVVPRGASVAGWDRPPCVPPNVTTVEMVVFIFLFYY